MKTAGSFFKNPLTGVQKRYIIYSQNIYNCYTINRNERKRPAMKTKIWNTTSNKMCSMCLMCAVMPKMEWPALSVAGIIANGA